MCKNECADAGAKGKLPQNDSMDRSASRGYRVRMGLIWDDAVSATAALTTVSVRKSLKVCGVERQTVKTVFGGSKI